MLLWRTWQTGVGGRRRLAVRLWDVTRSAKSPVLTLAAHTNTVFAICSGDLDGAGTPIAPSLVVTGGIDRSVRVWDTRTGESVITLDASSSTGAIPPMAMLPRLQAPYSRCRFAILQLGLWLQE